MWISLKKLLPTAAGRIGLRGEAEINEINKAWPGLMQETFKQKADTIKIKPISLKNKILFVNCQNSVWANELQAHQTEIIKKINQQIGRESLIKVRIIY